MNNKIKELAEQATLNAVTKNFNGTSVEVQVPSENWAKEFAELIVKECLDHIDTMERIAHASNASIPDDYDEYTYLQTLNVLKSLIKSQFEIE